MRFFYDWPTDLGLIVPPPVMGPPIEARWAFWEALGQHMAREELRVEDCPQGHAHIFLLDSVQVVMPQAYAPQFLDDLWASLVAMSDMHQGGAMAYYRIWQQGMSLEGWAADLRVVMAWPRVGFSPSWAWVVRDFSG